jgi:hypothetical protein
LVILLLVALAEMVFSNIGTMRDETASRDLARQFNLSEQQYASRLVTLAGLDLVAALGVLASLLGRWRLGRWIALLGFGGYGVYQIVAALTILPPNFQTPVSIAGALYLAFGVVAFVLAPFGSRRPTRDRAPRQR